MPYGISNEVWNTLTPSEQANAQRRVDNAGASFSEYASKEEAKAYNAQKFPAPRAPAILAPGQPDYSQDPYTMQPFVDGPGPAPGDGGGGGYIGNEIIPYPEPPPPPKLAESPEWLAYLNALGLEKSQFEADIAKQRAFLQSDAERQIGDLKPQYDQQRRGITGSLEARGVVRSGEFLRKIAENRATQGRQEGGIRAGLQGNMVSLESQLAQRLIDIDARKAERELQMRSNGYV